MTTRTATKLGGTLVGAAALAASFAAAADARIPEERWGDAPAVHVEAVVVPDAFERAVARTAKTRVAAAKASAMPDWFERAALRRMRA